MTSIAMQRQAIEDCLAYLEQAIPSRRHIIDVARAGCHTLAWLEKRQHLTRALHELDKQMPGLTELIESFPGTRITVRDCGDDPDPPRQHGPNEDFTL